MTLRRRGVLARGLLFLSTVALMMMQFGRAAAAGPASSTPPPTPSPQAPFVDVGGLHANFPPPRGPSGADQWQGLPAYSAAAAVAYVTSEARKVLSGATIRCADYVILRDNKTLGDGFSRLIPTADAIINRTVNAPIDGTAIRVDPKYLEGVNVWMIQHLQGIANFTVELYIVRIPDYLYNDADKTKTILYLMNTQGYDCVLSATQLITSRLPYMQFLTGGVQPYSYWIVAPKPVLSVLSLSERLWQWTSPFSGQVWGVLAAVLTGVGFVMFLLERKDNRKDFGNYETTAFYTQIWHGVYLAYAGFASKTEEFSPKTLPGRILGVVNAFVMWLALSFYIANLSVVFSNMGGMVQLISSIDDFAATDLPVCVPNKGVYLDFLATTYPALSVKRVGVNPNDLLEAIKAGDCAGGMNVDVSLLYTLGVGDEQASYCDLEMVGLGLNFGFYTMPFANHLPIAMMNSLNALASSTVYDGSYLNGAVELNLARDRTACAAHDRKYNEDIAENPAAGAPLQLVNFAGLFCVQALGVGAAAVLYFLQRFWLCAVPAKARGSPLGEGTAAHRFHRTDTPSGCWPIQCKEVQKEVSTALYNFGRTGKHRAERGARGTGQKEASARGVSPNVGPAGAHERGSQKHQHGNGGSRPHGLELEAKIHVLQELLRELEDKAHEGGDRGRRSSGGDAPSRTQISKLHISACSSDSSEGEGHGSPRWAGAGGGRGASLDGPHQRHQSRKAHGAGVTFSDAADPAAVRVDAPPAGAGAH